jgi:ribosomal protein L11 methyltransferase
MSNRFSHSGGGRGWKQVFAEKGRFIMKWNKYTIETTTAAEDYMSSMLMELGIEGIEIEDNIPLSREDQADMFIDFLPELPPDDGVSHVSFYIEDNGEDHMELLQEVKAGLEELRGTVDVGSGVITSDQTEDLDWINNWKKFFSSFYIEDILIKPTWEELKPEDADKFLIEIDPGVSFGTGKHETTQLCIRQLLKYIRGNEDHTPVNKAPKVLDVGCGSGILSIVALKLGASCVVGTDLDAACMTSTCDNMAVNHLDQKLGTFYVGNLIDDTQLQDKVGTEEYDIVVANILADVIIPMASVIPARLKSGGYFITSGIIDFKENQVKEAIEAAGLTVVEINHQGEWVNITARKD